MTAAQLGPLKRNNIHTQIDRQGAEDVAPLRAICRSAYGGK
jgi:hypothetical protein